MNHSSISENEFMGGPQQGDPMFDNFMQACLNNPSFFESMKQFYTQANQPNRNASPIIANPYNPSAISSIRGQSSRADEYRSGQEEDELEGTSVKQFKKDTKRLPANPLLKYQPQEQPQPPQNSNTIRRPQPQPDLKQSAFEEQPIKSRYIENVSTTPTSRASVDLNAIKENQSINVDAIERPTKPAKPTKEPNSRNFDDEPIRGMKAEDIEREYRDDDRPIKAMNSLDLEYYQEITQKPSKPTNVSKPAPKPQDDDRPLTGAKKDFKELIKEQFPEPFGQFGQAEEEEPEEKKVEPRNFLKRGSRQHLSSAMNKSKQPKKKEEDLDRSGLDRSRDLTPKNQNRSVSQNRVLGKKNANDKSINKGIPKNDPRDEDTLNSRAKPPMGTLKDKKLPPPPSKPALTPKVEPPSKKKKAKNVFDDDSESSSSEQEPYFKATTKPTTMVAPEPDDRTEVIDDVFLTSEQLEEILSRYGKASKPAPKETESEKIQAIRNKYTELCQLVEAEREAHQAEMEHQKEEFEKYKADQLNKLKNERRVMERQLKSGSTSQNLQKDREELEALRQDLEREREDYKKKDKNNRIMIDKYKKENDELRNKIERLESERESAVGSKRSLNVFKTEEQPEEKEKEKEKEKPTALRQSGKAAKKVVDEEPKEELSVSYKDIKKGKEGKQAKEAKVKYEYAEEEPVAKGKPSNVQKEVKIENKWASNKFNSDSESASNSDHEEEASGVEWSPTMKLSDLAKIDLSVKMVTDQMISALFRYETNIEYRRYQQAVKAAGRTVVNSTRNSKNSYVANLYSDRSKEHIYDNGTRKETLESGYTIIYFKNGDIKQTLPDQTILYYFKEKAVDQITLPNGLNIYRFENNQVELHFPNGYIEIRHPDGTIKVLGDHAHTRR